MPKKFTKKIISPGVYHVPSPGNAKERVPVLVSRDRLKRWADNHSKMRESGIQVPAPWRHDPRAEPVRLEGDEQDVDSYRNAGFWDKVWQEDDGSLSGELTVHRDEDAERIGKTVTEVSALAKQEWTDGSGETYEDAMTHIALVTHPVVKGQENFKKGSRQFKELAAAHIFSSETFVSGDVEAFGNELINQDGQTAVGTRPGTGEFNANGSTVSDAINALKSVGLVLPQDTDINSLCERIVTAAGSVEASSGRVGTVSSAPTGATTQPNQVFLGEVMPEKNKKVMQFDPFTGEKLSDDQIAKGYAKQLIADGEVDVQLSQETQATINFAKNTAAKQYRDRVEHLVKSGRLSPNMANEKFIPLLKDLQFSFNADGKPVSGKLDSILEILEDLPENVGLTGATPTGALTDRAKFDGQHFSLAHNVKEVDIEKFSAGDSPEPGFGDAEDEDAVEQRVEMQLRNAGLNSSQVEGGYYATSKD